MPKLDFEIKVCSMYEIISLSFIYWGMSLFKGNEMESNLN
jgi:hypothetical protein